MDKFKSQNGASVSEELENTLCTYRNTYNLSVKFSSKSDKNIILKINKGLTNFVTRQYVIIVVHVGSEESTLVVTSQIKGFLSSKRMFN